MVEIVGGVAAGRLVVDPTAVEHEGLVARINGDSEGPSIEEVVGSTSNITCGRGIHQ